MTMMLPQPVPARAGHRHWQQGVDHAQRRDWVGAARAFRRAVRAAPGDALYWINLANTYRHAGDHARALGAVGHALALDAAQPLALRLQGEALAALHRYPEAVAAFEKLWATGAREPDAMLQHAAMLQALRKPKESIELLMEAAALEPAMLQLHAMMATAFRDMALQNEAIECLKTVLALDPGNLQALAHLSYEKRHVCDWSDLDADIARLQQVLATLPAGMARLSSSFSLLSLPLDPALQLAASRAEALAAMVGARELAPLTAAEHAQRTTDTARRPRIGMLSFDFHEHPVSQLIVEMLERMNGSRFEVTLYSTGRDDGSALRQRIERAADHFVDLRGTSDALAAERIRADGTDILVDLQGHTRGHRSAILARRPAPVQVAYLGYPASSGAPYIDYLIGDPLVTPVQLAHLYTEKLAQMPLTFQPNGGWRPVPEQAMPAMTRERAGLPAEGFVMCAFNHTYKILPEAFDAWCAVMREVPGSVLWLKETNGQLHDNVRREAQARGVAGERIVFARAVAYAEHFARLALADVFVDTWPYNAHTTAADALWAGVPVVTLHGNGFASRVAASVLNAAGMAELAFERVEDYCAAITALAREPALHAGYREHLRTRRRELPLFDCARYTREFEDLLARMWRRWAAGEAPQHLLAE
ncbi:MAG: UDP-N-acetylglucosamine-peptide N-acetylglucosaminyltransferase [Rubrivivax sp.]|nr:UDP-N-acetylglucosamine-peptide N-acetylglucosaminyltransferase [Rubrivivax sp.]